MIGAGADDRPPGGRIIRSPWLIIRNENQQNAIFFEERPGAIIRKLRNDRPLPGSDHSLSPDHPHTRKDMH